MYTYIKIYHNTNTNNMIVFNNDRNHEHNNTNNTNNKKQTVIRNITLLANESLTPSGAAVGLRSGFPECCFMLSCLCPILSNAPKGNGIWATGS